jgi:sulfite reductase beta subunit-like hemoprotein
LHTAVVPDRCPGVLRLHEAADGWLARVRVPGGRIAPEGLEAIAAVALRGNGIIELTSRASVQVRGLDAGDGDACAGHLAPAGLLPAPSHERARNILASPVAGRHPASTVDADAVVRSLDAAICADPELAQLSGRFLFAVLDGSPTLDVRRAGAIVRPGDRIDDAVAAARRTLGAGTTPTSERAVAASGRSELTPGALIQRDGRSAITATVPLARLDPAAATALASIARRNRTDVRIAAERTVTLVDIDPAQTAAVTSELVALGLVAERSGWDGLTACAGLGACRKAELDVRALAAMRSRRRSPADPPEHWAACSRGCGRPADAVLRGAR